MSNKKPPIERVLLIDPDTGAQTVKVTVDAKSSDPKAIAEIKAMIHRASPAGRIAHLRKLAEDLPDDYPEKQAALEHLDHAGSSDVAHRLLWIAEATTLLEHSKIRQDGRKKRDAARKAGKASGAARRNAEFTEDDNKEEARKLHNELLSKGRGQREVAGIIAKTLEVAPHTVRRWTKDLRTK